MDPGDVLMDKDDRDDRDLRALFAREPALFAEQPFVGELAHRIAAERSRRALAMRFVRAAGVGGAIATLIATSPWLISGSAVLSTKIAAVFSSTGNALERPFGYAAGIVLVIAAFAFRRRLLG
jgi:hypothetical protein